MRDEVGDTVSSRRTRYKQCDEEAADMLDFAASRPNNRNKHWVKSTLGTWFHTSEQYYERLFRKIAGTSPRQAGEKHMHREVEKAYSAAFAVSFDKVLSPKHCPHPINFSTLA